MLRNSVRKFALTQRPIRLNKDYIMSNQKKESYADWNGNLNKAAGSLLASRWLRLTLAILLIVPGLSAYGQFESASVLGYVKDTSGAAIPNTTVTLTNAATGI